MGTASGNPRSAGGLSALRDFAALVDLAGEFIGVWDLDRRPLFVNPSGLELVGLDCLESALALRADDLFFPEDRDRVFGEFFSRVLEQGRGEMEVRFRHFKTGEPIWMLYTNLVLRDSEGRPELIATVSRDITKYRRDAAIAEEQTVQLQVLVDALPGLFAHVDGDLRYTWVNRGHAEFFRTTVADTIGKPVREMVSEDVYEVVAQNLHRAIAGESQCFDIELTPSGSDTAEYVRSMYVPDGTGSGCFAMAFDITVQKNLERQLRQALADLSELSSRKDYFLATLAHELRNPLAPLRTGLALLQEQCSDDEQRETVSSMTRQLGQVVRLVNDLLDVARISRDKLVLQPEMIDFHEVVRDAIAAVEPFVAEAGHALVLDAPQDGPAMIYADRARLIQVCSNLLHNAVKFTPDGGEIRLAMRTSEEQVELTVQDSGAGVDPADFDNIFHLFTQIGSTDDPQAAGLGLGLTMVKSFVELHGGTVSVESEGPGMGATFRVLLPRRAPLAPDEPRPDAARRTEVKPERRRILIVDDNRAGADLLSKLVRSMGHEVSTAYDGAEAVRVAKQTKPELIIMDIGMPELNGYEAASAMRDEPWRAHAKVVALTGWGQRADRARALDAGFDDHIVKPVEPDQIETLIAELSDAHPRDQAADRP